MEIEEQKKFLKKALIDSFVEESDAYKKTIKIINSDLNKSNINYQYTYDEFCVEFLNETLKNIDKIDIFGYDEFNQFYVNFWNFNLYNLRQMLNTKLTKLGHSFDEFYNKSEMKNKINEN
jgi:hypothetical protein